MYAHYISTSKAKWVIISETTRPVGDSIPVKGKVMARKIAKHYKAIPWNF